MARNKRKQNLKIQMLAGNRLKSFPNARSQKTTTLVNALVYVDIDQGIHLGKNKVVRNEKWKKQLWVFVYIYIYI